jgi:hypothetical protein
MESFLNIFKNKKTKVIKTISNITDNFTDNNYYMLSNGEKIQYMGMIYNSPYFLFSNNNITFYLKFIKNIGFSIIYNTDELNNDIINIGKVDKLPNIKKITSTMALIDKTDNTNIFYINNILKIGHINSIYSRTDNTNISDFTSVVDYSEYLLFCDNIRSILCYSFASGYSIINKY